MKLRRQLRNRKIKLFRCLRDRSQLTTRGGRVIPIDFESIPLCIGLSDRQHRLAKLADDLQSREIPSYSFGSSFMRPTVKSQWRCAGRVEVEHTPNLNVRHTQMYRYKLKKEKYRIQYQSIHPGFCYLAWQMLQCCSK